MRKENTFEVGTIVCGQWQDTLLENATYNECVTFAHSYSGNEMLEIFDTDYHTISEFWKNGNQLDVKEQETVIYEELIEKQFLNDDELETLQELSIVESVENLGYSGTYYPSLWYVVKLENGQEDSVYSVDSE